MIELICETPAYIGWSLVAVELALCVALGVALGKVIIEAIKERRED